LTAKNSDGELDVSSVQLLGEVTYSVEVYNICDKIRTKTSTLLKHYLTETAASPFRRLAFNSGRNNFSANIAGCLSYLKWPHSENMSEASYATYPFFHKFRIKQEKEKIKDHFKIEKLWRTIGMQG
jgi:hypothetical protein